MSYRGPGVVPPYFYNKKNSCNETVECQKRIDSGKKQDNPSVLIPVLNTHNLLQDTLIQFYSKHSLTYPVHVTCIFTRNFSKINKI